MAHAFVFVIFGGLGLMLLAVGAREAWRQQRLLAHARPVEARIVVSAVRESRSTPAGEAHGDVTRLSGTTVSHRPDVRFVYEVDGRAHENDWLQPTCIVQAAGEDAAIEVVQRYPVGARVMAWVDPAHPEWGFLERRASIGPRVYLTVGLLLPPLAWWVGVHL